MKPKGRKAVGRTQTPGSTPSRPLEPHSRGRKAPTPQERNFVEGVAQGKTDKQAALDAGYSLSMAENTKYKLWTKPHVQTYFRDTLRRSVPPERVLQRMSELVEGRSVTKKRKQTFEAGKLVNETIEETEIVNASISLRAIRMAAEWAGYIPTKQPAITVDTITQVNLQPEQEPGTKPVDVNCLPSPKLSEGTSDGEVGPDESGDGAARPTSAPNPKESLAPDSPSLEEEKNGRAE